MTDAAAAPPYFPYANAATNEIYNLLFCDDANSFKPKPDQDAPTRQVSLFAEPPDGSHLRALAADSTLDGRARYLAYAKLRQLKQSVPPKVLLGVIVEVPLADGLDVLAAFCDGGVRYLNQSGKLAVFEGVQVIEPLVAELFRAAQAVVNRIGPWDNPRTPPPANGRVRLTFLVSDGLYFGEGPMSVMRSEPLAGPVIAHATSLLQTVVAMTTK